MRTLGHRVAQRFIAAREKRAFILPYAPDENRGGRPYNPEEEIEKGEEAVKKALPLAKKVLSDLKSLEADAKEVQRDGVKEVENFLEALQGLDAKKSAPFIAATHAALAKLKGNQWLSMLGYDNGLSDLGKVLYELPRKLRAYLTKAKETEPVKKLDAAYKSFAVVSKKHHQVQERFGALKDVGYQIWHHIEYTEILIPSGYKGGWYVGKPFDTLNMEAYNSLWKKVRGVAQYMTIYEDKAEERYAGMVANLEEMGKLLDGMMNDYVRATYRDPDAALKSKGR
jgi:hypothetical protein